jgi:hypothetical protein
MKQFDKQALLEGVKEFIRTGVLASISYLLTEGVLQGILLWLFGTNLDTVQILGLTSFLTTLFRSVDKWLHEKDVKSPLDLEVVDTLVK